MTDTCLQRDERDSSDALRSSRSSAGCIPAGQLAHWFDAVWPKAHVAHDEWQHEPPRCKEVHRQQHHAFVAKDAHGFTPKEARTRTSAPEHAVHVVAAEHVVQLAWQSVHGAMVASP